MKWLLRKLLNIVRKDVTIDIHKSNGAYILTVIVLGITIIHKSIVI